MTKGAREEREEERQKTDGKRVQGREGRGEGRGRESARCRC
jgi:hypothetical protein